MLTAKQHELLNFIDESQKASGITPSFDEMKGALNLASKSGIHRLVTALEERGFLRRLPNRARALEVIRRPEKGGRGRAATAASSLIEESFARVAAAAGELSRLVSIPVVGRIAAGAPIEAIETQGRVLAFSADELPAGEHYALEVRGDSMTEAGIFDGDTVVIHRQDSARNGDIVVALVDKAEATLKRYRRQGRTIALEAANPAYETRMVDESRVDVQGRLVSLLRRY